jgi:ATP/maltotriose-dependent transcriptional regulator MalT
MEAPALVGRREELAYLAERLARVRGGPARIVVVTGEPGIGKTRLLTELAARARGGATVLIGRGSPLSASIPFAILAEAIGAHLRTESPEELDALVRHTGAELAAVLPTVAGAGEGARGADRLAILEALARLVARLSERAPLLVVLDDLHQADASTWEFVGYLGRNPPAAPVLIVAAVRPAAIRESVDLQRHVSTLIKDGLADELRLGPLNADAIADLARRSLGPVAADAELRAWLFDRTRGNALYAVALLEELRHDPTRRVVPVSVRERVRMEAADLSPVAAEALEIAAVLGHSFPLRQIAATLPRGSGAELDELVRRGLMVERDDGAPSYDFVHPLVQEAVYETIGAGRRRELHARVAAALAAEPIAVRAYHVARGALPGDGEAIRVLHEAATEAERAQAHREALGHLLAALELVPKDGGGRRELLDRIAWHAAEASDHTIAIPVLRELADVVRDDPVELATTRMRLASVLSTGAGDLAAAETEARAAVELFEREAPERLAAAINELGWIQAFAGDFAAQDQACRRAIALAETEGNETALLHALGPLGHSLSLRGRFEEAHALTQRCVDMAHRTGDAAQIGWHRGVRAMAYGLEGRLADGAAAIDPLLASGPSPSDVAYFNRAWLNWFHGRWSMGMADCEAIEALHPTVPSAHSAWTLSLAAALHAAAGSPARGRPLLAQADRVYADGEFYWFSAAHRWATGHVAWLEGDVARASEMFERAVGWIRRCGLSALECQMLPDLVESLADAGRLAEARAAADRGGRLAEELATPFARAVALHAAGIVEGEPEKLTAAAEIYEQVRADALAARAFERLGRTATGDERTAALTEAARRYAELPAPALGERARAELRRSGAKGRRAAQRVGELTEREREILALVRRGLTSREMAEQLHLSVRTVDSHLTRIYGKLGVSGRRELGRA